MKLSNITGVFPERELFGCFKERLSSKCHSADGATVCMKHVKHHPSR